METHFVEAFQLVQNPLVPSCVIFRAILLISSIVGRLSKNFKNSKDEAQEISFPDVERSEEKQRSDSKQGLQEPKQNGALQSGEHRIQN